MNGISHLIIHPTLRLACVGLWLLLSLQVAVCAQDDGSELGDTPNSLRSVNPAGPAAAAGNVPQAAAPAAGNGSTTQADSGVDGAAEVAAPPASQTVPAELAEKISKSLEQLTAAAANSPTEASDALIKSYQQALAKLNAATEARETANKNEASQQAAPASIASAQTKLEQLKNAPKPTPVPPTFDSLEQGQQTLQTLTAELNAAVTRRNQLAEQIATRDQRLKEIPQLVSDLKQQLDALTSAPSAASENSDPQLREAGEWNQQAEQLALAARIEALESEQRRYEAEAALLPMQIDLARSDELRLQEQVRRVTNVLEKLRSDRIAQQRMQIRTLSQAQNDPEFQEQAERLLQHLDDWKEIAAERTALNDITQTDQETFDYWKGQRQAMASRVDSTPGAEGFGSFNSWVGLELREQRGKLPDPQRLATEIDELRTKMRTADALRSKLDDLLRQAQVHRDALERRNIQAAESASTDFSGDGLSLEPSAAPVPRTEMELVDKTIEVARAMKLDVSSYLIDLYRAADIKENTIVLSREYRSFIDQHVLWIRSCEQLQPSDWPIAAEALRWLITPSYWINAAALLRTDFFNAPWWYLAFAAGFLLLVFNQPRLRRKLGQIGEKAVKKNCTDYKLTLKAFVITLLISSPMALLLMFVEWRLSSQSQKLFTTAAELDFVNALSTGLLVAASTFMPMELLRQISRGGGLGTMHFGWSPATARRLSLNLRWLIDFAVPLATIISILGSQSDPRLDSALGRIAFIFLMVLLAIFLARLFVPSQGVFSEYLAAHRNGWVERTSFFWYPALIVGPLLLAAAAYLGFYYTATRISMHLSASFWMLAILILVYCLLSRLVVLNRRRLMLQKARERLQEANRRSQSGLGPPADEPTVNMVDLNDQTKRILSSLVVTAGLVIGYFIWSDVLPAITILQGVELYTVESTSADEENVVITLANVVLVIPIVFLVVIAARNLPGLLEITFLQRLPLTNAAKYAVTTLCRYTIFLVGILAISSTIGLRWTDVQFLVAALGVGLGFGLQEIFANFVSGIILLFEQPLRVGDVITIDGTTGTVSKIRMRATTIVNWDRQELIVPNKDLITGKLLNWTLSDTTNRVVVNVGVAYGSDTKRACEIVREICGQHPNVMDEPAPIVTFEGFGDNTLNIVSRVYLASLDNRLVTIHELHQQIYEAFAAANIEIAFPQRDLHIRSVPQELKQWLTRGKDN